MRGGYMPLIFYFFIFSFLFSFVQGFTTIVFSYLGLPLALSFVAAVFLLGGGAFLFFRGYPLPTYGLGLCIFFAVLAAAALLRGLTVSEPETPPGMPDGVLEDYYVDTAYLDAEGYFNFDLTAGLREDPAVIQPVFQWAGEAPGPAIELAALQTAGGQWGLLDAEVRVSGAQNGRIQLPNRFNAFVNPANPDFRTGLAPREVVPVVQVPLDVVLVPSAAQSFNLVVDAELIYPNVDGAVVTETITRDVTVIVPTNDIYTYQSAYADFTRAADIINRFPGWYGLLGMIGLAAVGGVFMVREGALNKPSGGPGLRVVVREMSGLQKLGLEAHELDALKDEPIEGVREGVLVGVVNAQSPAGRADIRSGDVIVSFDGTPVKTPKGLQRLSAKQQRGDTAQVVLVRFGQQQTVTVKF